MVGLVWSGPVPSPPSTIPPIWSWSLEFPSVRTTGGIHLLEPRATAGRPNTSQSSQSRCGSPNACWPVLNPSGPSGTASRPLRTVDQGCRAISADQKASPSDGTLQSGMPRHSTARDADLTSSGTVPRKRKQRKPPRASVIAQIA